jgi:hypothetical protein
MHATNYYSEKVLSKPKYVGLLILAFVFGAVGGAGIEIVFITLLLIISDMLSRLTSSDGFLDGCAVFLMLVSPLSFVVFLARRNWNSGPRVILAMAIGAVLSIVSLVIGLIICIV